MLIIINSFYSLKQGPFFSSQLVPTVKQMTYSQWRESPFSWQLHVHYFWICRMRDHFNKYSNNLTKFKHKNKSESASNLQGEIPPEIIEFKSCIKIYDVTIPKIFSIISKLWFCSIKFSQATSLKNMLSITYFVKGYWYSECSNFAWFYPSKFWTSSALVCGAFLNNPTHWILPFYKLFFCNQSLCCTKASFNAYLGG